MPTENFNLPLIADNMANDVVRDMNALAEATDGALKTMSDGKVDKVNGKQLSTNDYTSTEKTKLAGIASGANNTTVINTLTNTSTASALSAAQGKVLKDLVDSKASNTDLTSLNNRVTTHLDESAQWIEFNLDISSISIPNNVKTPVVFINRDLYNNADFAKLDASGRIQLLERGVYEGFMQVSWQSNAIGYRQLEMSNMNIYQNAVNGVFTGMSTSTLMQYDAGAIIPISVLQNSGGTLNLVAARIRIRKVANL